ncbi:hemagglutinin repeat-containing protein, partial [Chelonobacter oris]|uniref:hemagglutinin repeat-containing protein n=1 Tax=Chelonobacter oris TaxID=505317 RepID=UPI001F259106
MTNRQGLIASRDRLNLTAEDKIENQQGHIIAETALSVNSDMLNNTEQGEITTAGQMSITVSNIDNQGGSLRAEQDLILRAADIQNQRVADNGSFIQAGQTLTIDTRQLNNSDTKAAASQTAPMQGMAASHIRLTAQALDNQRGGVYADNSVTLTLAQKLDNQEGELIALKTLSLAGDTLQIINRQGVIESGEQLSIQAKRLSGDGKIESHGTLSIGLQDDFVSTTDMKAKTNFVFSTAGHLINQAQLFSEGTLQLNANDLVNTETGIIHGADTKISLNNRLNNKGLINSDNENGGAKTVIKGNIIENIGSGRIYGDYVALQAEKILNMDDLIQGEIKSGTIASREKLILAAKDIINETRHYTEDKKNGATLYSDGEMIFGRTLNQADEAEGVAEHLWNRSGIIEAVKKINLNVRETINSNEHFSTQILEYPEEGDRNSIEYIILNPVNQDLNTGHRVKIDRFVQVGLGNGVYDHGWNKNLNRKLADDELDAGYIPEANTTNCLKADNSLCYYKPTTLYVENDAIWERFDVSAPKESAPDLSHLPIVREEPKKPWIWFSSNGSRRFEEYLKDLQAYKLEVEAYNEALNPYKEWVEKKADSFAQLNTKIQQHNSQYNTNLSERWSIKVNEKKVFKTTVKTSLPGQILAGGDILLGSNSLINDKSTIISGGEIVSSSAAELIQNKTAWGETRAEYHGIKHWYDAWSDGGPFGSKWRWHGDQEGPVLRIEKLPLDLKMYSVIEHAVPQRVAAVETVNLPNSDDSLPSIKLASGVSLDLSSETQTNLQPTTLSAPSRVAGIRELGELQPIEVRSMQVDTRLPAQSLYKINPDAESHYLIETDPDFTQYRKWLSSDYMFDQLRYEPNSMHKRLGDGYYEQRLVLEQINRLTGRQFTGEYTDFDSQYRALMEAGVSTARRFNLRPGIRLTNAQVAQLTTDIVWLESESIILSDGSKADVLVPKVYVVTKPDDLKGSGSLLSADKLNLNTRHLINDGVLAGRQLIKLSGGSLNNAGQISGDIFIADITGNMENLGGAIEANQALLLNVGGDITLANTTSASEVDLTGYQRTETQLSRKGLLYVKGEHGMLQMSATNIAANGVDIINQGRGLTRISAKNDLSLGVTNIDISEKMGVGDHYRNTSEEHVIVSRIQGGGDVKLDAKNIYSEGAEIEAGQKLIALAENNIVLNAVANSSNYEEFHHNKHSSALSKSSETMFDSLNQIQQKGSHLSGESILLKAGNDIQLTGGSIVAERDADMMAQNNIDILAATNQYQEVHRRETKKSGLMSSGGIGVTFGSKSESHHYDEKGITQSDARATIGSLGGNVTIAAGNHANVLATDLIAQADKSINIQGKTLKVEAGKDIIDSAERHEFKQSGLTVALSTPVTDAAFAMQKNLKRSAAVKDSRLSALYKVKAATEAAMAAQSAAATADTLGSMANGAMQEGAVSHPQVKVSVSVGASQSTQTGNSTQVTHSGSEFNAGNINLTA